MKQLKHFLTLTIVLISTLAFSQTGDIWLGGSLGFNVHSVKDSDLKSTNWTFSPEVATFLNDHMQIGIGITIRGSKDDETSSVLGNYSFKTIATGATLYGRHFFNAGAPFRPFIGLNINALPGKTTIDYDGTANDTEIKTFDFGVNLNAGFGYAISPKWTAVGSFGFLGFRSVSSKFEGSDDKSVSSDFGLNASTLGDRFTIGFYYTL